MSKNTSIALGEHFQDFIQEQLKEGRFGSTSEVIRAGLRLLEEHNTKLTVLRCAIQEGIVNASGLQFHIIQAIFTNGYIRTDLCDGIRQVLA